MRIQAVDADEIIRCVVYIECRAESSAEAQDGADEVLVDLSRLWFRPEETGLRPP